jgi:hypothetical protein
MGKKFQRTTEDFTCEWCGSKVKGTGYTDHCPNCLCSKHVDVNPGDRANPCNGKMVPKSAVYQGGVFRISYLCLRCGEERSIKAAEEDNKDLLIQLSVAPAKRKR